MYIFVPCCCSLSKIVFGSSNDFVFYLLCVIYFYTTKVCILCIYAYTWIAYKKLVFLFIFIRRCMYIYYYSLIHTCVCRIKDDTVRPNIDINCHLIGTFEIMLDHLTDHLLVNACSDFRTRANTCSSSLVLWKKTRSAFTCPIWASTYCVAHYNQTRQHHIVEVFFLSSMDESVIGR